VPRQLSLWRGERLLQFVVSIAEADFLAFEELLSHAIHGHVEDGGNVCLVLVRDSLIDFKEVTVH